MVSVMLGMGVIGRASGDILLVDSVVIEVLEGNILSLVKARSNSLC